MSFFDGEFLKCDILPVSNDPVLIVIPVVAIAITAVILTVIVVSTSSIRGSWAIVIIVSIGVALVLTRIRVPGLDLANRCGRSAIEHIVLALFDSVRS